MGVSPKFISENNHNDSDHDVKNDGTVNYSPVKKKQFAKDARLERNNYSYKFVEIKDEECSHDNEMALSTKDAFEKIKLMQETIIEVQFVSNNVLMRSIINRTMTSRTMFYAIICVWIFSLLVKTRLWSLSFSMDVALC